MVVVLYRLLGAAGFRWAAPAGAALAGTLPISLNTASAGMETPLYSLLILLMFRQVAVAAETARTAAASALAVGVGLCRPDGAIAVAVACAGLCLSRPRAAWRFLWPLLVVAAVTAAVAVAYYGTVVPQSVVSKAAGDRTAWGGVRLLAELLLARFHFVPTACAILGAAALWTRRPAWRWLLVWWLAYAAVFSVTGALLHADWYFVPLQPVYWGCVAVGLEVAACRVLTRHYARIAFAAAALTMVALMVRGWPVHRAAFAQVQAIREQPYLDAGRWIAASDRPCDVAATEIGAIGFAFPGRIIDLAGLVTPSAVRRPAAAVIEEHRAQWLVTQNIYMPDGVLEAPSFTAAFDRVSSVPLEAGRSLDLYKRREGLCRSNR
jgi:hypothetical protein